MARCGAVHKCNSPLKDYGAGHLNSGLLQLKYHTRLVRALRFRFQKFFRFSRYGLINQTKAYISIQYILFWPILQVLTKYLMKAQRFWKTRLSNSNSRNTLTLIGRGTHMCQLIDSSLILIIVWRISGVIAPRYYTNTRQIKRIKLVDFMSASIILQRLNNNTCQLCSRIPQPKFLDVKYTQLNLITWSSVSCDET